MVKHAIQSNEVIVLFEKISLQNEVSVSNKMKV